MLKARECMGLTDFKNTVELVNLISEVSVDKKAIVYENRELMDKIFKFTRTVDQKESAYTRILDFISGYWEYMADKA
jgi:hypothetical protein